MKIWIVSVGEYSDYRVVGLVDEEHKAEAKKKCGLLGGRVEDTPIELNTITNVVDPGMDFYQVVMDRDGTLTKGYGLQNRTRELGRLNLDGKRHEERWHLTKISYRGESPVPIWQLGVHVYARSDEHAIKIANETRIGILAGAKEESGSFKRVQSK